MTDLLRPGQQKNASETPVSIAANHYVWETSTGYALNCEPERVVRSGLVRGREVRRSGGSAGTRGAIGAVGPGGALAFALALAFRLLRSGDDLARLAAVLSKRPEFGSFVVLLDEGNGALGTLAVEPLLDRDRARATAGWDEEALGEVVLEVALARRRDALHAGDAALATVDVLLQELYARMQRPSKRDERHPGRDNEHLFLAQQRQGGAYHLGVDIATVLVETRQRERDCALAFGGGGLDTTVGGGEDDEDAGEKGGEGKSELHDDTWDRPAL